MNKRNDMRIDATATAQMVSNEDLENLVIGSIVNFAHNGTIVNDLPAIFMSVSEDDFYFSATKKLFRVIRNLHDSSQSINMASVIMDAQKEGVDMANAASIMRNVCNGTFDLMKNEIPRLKELSSKRKIWLVGQQLSMIGTSYASDIDNGIEDSIKTLLTVTGEAKASCVVSGGDVIKNIIGIIDKNRVEGIDGLVTKTGFPEIDEVSGLCASDLCIIGAATSQGKTSFATNIVTNAMRNGKKVAFYSLEMTKEQVVTRMISPIAHMRQNDILRSQLSNVAVRMFDDAVVAFSEYQDNIYFDDRSTRTINDIKASIRYMQKSRGIEGAVIDYLGLIAKEDPKQVTQEHMAYCARELKNLAKELNIWIIALVQFNRSGSIEDHTPTLERLRDSAQIADAADLVLFLYRPETEGKKYRDFPNVNPEGTAEVLIEKNRNGAKTKFICGFDAQYTLFYPLDRVPVIACDARAAVTDHSNETPF